MDVNLIAAFFLILGILTIIKLALTKTYYDSFWFCDIAPFILAISFFTGSVQFIKALINIGLLTQLVTLSLLLFGFVSGKDISGSKEALSRGKFYVFVEILIHLPIILALVLTYHLAPKAESLLYSFILLGAMFFFTLAFTSPRRNINMIYSLGVPSGKKNQELKLPFHTALWIFYAFIVALLTFLIQYILYLHTGT